MLGNRTDVFTLNFMKLFILKILNNSIELIGVMLPHVFPGDLHVRKLFGVVVQLAVSAICSRHILHLSLDTVNLRLNDA